MTRKAFSSLLAVCLLLALGLMTSAATEEKAPELPKVAKGSVRASMEVGYCCGGCAAKVEDAVGALKGVTFVNADVPTKTCTVDYKEKEIKLQKIKDTILALGYSVDGVEPSAPHGEG